MPDDVLQFTCQACQTNLTVPLQLAGIEGPCPKCGAVIKAPEAAPAPEADPGCRPAGTLPEKRNPPPARPAEQASIRPQPRDLPDRPERPSVSPRHSTADVAKRPEPKAERSDRPESGSPGVTRFLIPVAFLLVGGALTFFLLDSFMGNAEPPPPQPTPPPAVTPDGPTAAPVDPTPPGGTAGTPTPSPETAPAESTGDPAAQNDSLEVQDVLRDFLRASSIGARLPLIEPPYERDALEGSVIDTPLLSASRITPDAPTRNSLENYVDHPFNVRFERDGESSVDILVVVRKRAEQKPKILIDPLLDLLGGRLEAFAAEPSEETRTFRAVIEPMPRCFEEGIPNPDDKFTYKLSANHHGGEIARAYASKLSPLAEMLYAPDSALRWGKRLPATITVKWTTEAEKAPAEEADGGDDGDAVDDAPADPESAPADTQEGPATPYLEVIEIKSLDWSP